MFILDQKKERNTSAIMLVSYYLPKLRLTWGTGISVAPKDWDASKRTVKKTHREHIWLNAKLSKYKETFEICLADYRITNQAQPDHAYLKAKLNEVRDKLDGRASLSKKEPKKPSTSFVEFATDFIKRTKDSAKTGPRTHYHFVSVLNNLKLYHLQTKAPLEWDAFNYAWFEDWQNWSFLEEVRNSSGKLIKDQLAQNTMATYWKNFKKMLLDAKDFYKSKDHERPSLTIGYQESDQPYLDINELMAIHALDLANEPAQLQEHRDYALFNAFCGGFRFGDLESLGNRSNIIPLESVDMLRFRTSKTDTEVVVPGHWYYNEFVEKYGQQWPRIGNNQLFNNNLKLLARMADIEHPVTRRVNKGGQNQWETAPKCDLVHQYTLRYSYATNLDEAGVAIQDIMRLMGHTNIKTTMRYIKTKAHQTALRVAGNAYFTTKPERPALKASQA